MTNPLTRRALTWLTATLALGATGCQAPAATVLPAALAPVATPLAAPRFSLLALDDVATLAGTGAIGFRDDLDQAGSATFNGPDGLTSDGAGTLSVTDSQNHAIRQLDAQTGFVRTLAGNGAQGYADGVGAAASFRYPSGITRDRRTGDLYVADRGNHCIRKVDPLGVVTTYAGTGQVAGNLDGPARQARFNSPVGVAIAPDGTLFVVDYGNNRVRKVAPDGGEVTPVAGALNGFAGYVDGHGATARFRQPRQCALGPDGFLYVADGYNDALRAISVSGSVFTKATGLYRPEAVAVGPDGGVYVGGNIDRRIHRIGYDGIRTTFAGTGVWGYADGPRADAQFKMPRGLAFDDAGDLYVADLGNQRIRRIDL